MARGRRGRSGGRGGGAAADLQRPAASACCSSRGAKRDRSTGRSSRCCERVSANISFALDNFDHEAARKNGERAMRRLNRMFGAISATNEAILRAKTEQELYQRVCDAAVHSGKSAATVVLLAEPGSIWLKPVAGTGEIVEQIMRARVLDRSGQHLWKRRLRQRVPNAEALRQPRYPQLRAGAALAADRARDRRHRLRRAAADQGRREHRRVDVLRR